MSGMVCSMQNNAILAVYEGSWRTLPSLLCLINVSVLFKKLE